MSLVSMIFIFFFFTKSQNKFIFKNSPHQCTGLDEICYRKQPPMLIVGARFLVEKLFEDGQFVLILESVVKPIYPSLRSSESKNSENVFIRQ